MKEKKIKIRVAGFLFIDHKLLLVEHKKEKSLHWVIPGGGIEFQETASKALKREFKEELDLDISVGEYLFADEVIWNNRHNIDLYFKVNLNSDFNIKLEQGTALTQYRLFAKSEISSIHIEPNLQSIISKSFDDNFYRGFKDYEK